MEAAMRMHFLSLGIHEEYDGNNVEDWEEAEEEESEDGEPSANCSIKAGDISVVVERWLTELGVGWVLSLDDDGASLGEELDRHAQSWILALGHIAQNFCSMRPLFPDPDSVVLPSICQREGEHVGERCVPDQYHLVLFILETMSKMLNFVDVLICWGPNMREKFLSMDRVMPPAYNKLTTLLGVHNALSEASTMILSKFHSPTSPVQVRRMDSEMDNLLSAYKSKLGETIRSTMEKIKTELLEDGNDSSSSLNPQGSSDIHKVSRSVMAYIRFLRTTYLSVGTAIPGKYAPHIEDVPPLDSMIIEMVSCLQGKLDDISLSISDQGLRSLFLLNNSYFIENSQHFYYLGLNLQIEGHIERYLQVSWAPLLSCLFNPTPLCLAKNYSPLSKFESEFQKIYTTQKQWKVPNPVLRRRLCKVITDKIIPGYTEYIEDNKVTNPKFSPQELKAMLQELFEG